MHTPGKIFDGEIMLKTEVYLIETADRCIRLAREGRQLIERLEMISNEMMAMAVALDTRRDKKANIADKSGDTPTS